MENKYCVVRTDDVAGVKQNADLLSVRFYDADGNIAEVENGVVVKLEGYVNNRIVFNQETGKAVRAYIPRSRNLFAFTAEGFVNKAVPEKGANVGIGANGKIDAAGSGLGKCVDIDVAGRYTYYTIMIDKTEKA